MSLSGLRTDETMLRMDDLFRGKQSPLHEYPQAILNFIRETSASMAIISTFGVLDSLRDTTMKKAI